MKLVQCAVCVQAAIQPARLGGDESLRATAGTPNLHATLAPIPDVRLFFVRHGETDHNVARRIQGPLLDDPLNERGRMQAKALEARFADERARGLRVDAVYSSPMKRAWETALALARGAGVPEVVPQPGFTEFSWGVYLGQREEGPVVAAMREIHARWDRGEDDHAPPQGESPRQAWARASSALEAILARHPTGTVALVAHGRINKIVLSSLVHADRSRMDEFPQGNTGVTLLEADDGAGLKGPWRVVYVNRKDHLAQLAETLPGTGAEGEPPLV